MFHFQAPRFGQHYPIFKIFFFLFSFSLLGIDSSMLCTRVVGLYFIFMPQVLKNIRVIRKVNWNLILIFRTTLANLTHIKCVGTPQWPTLGMVEALVCGLEGGGDNGG